MHDTYTKEILKADLFDTINNQIFGTDQVISRLEDVQERQNCEIAEIQIAYSNYKSLLHIVEIQSYV